MVYRLIEGRFASWHDIEHEMSLDDVDRICLYLDAVAEARIPK